MPVNIKGKSYTMVGERVKQAHEDHNGEVEIDTNIFELTNERVIFRAELKINGKLFTGHALEIFGSNMINTTSALENCETSAIGRALAAAGYSGSEYCSADELTNALINQEVRSKDETKEPTEKQKNLLWDLVKKITDEEIKKEWIIKGQNEKDRFKFSILIQDLKKELGLNGFPAT
jgi:S-adenosylmethionine synthetase